MRALASGPGGARSSGIDPYSYTRDDVRARVRARPSVHACTHAFCIQAQTLNKTAKLRVKASRQNKLQRAYD